MARLRLARILRPALLLALVLAIAAIGVAVGSIPSLNGTIFACMDNASRHVRLIDKQPGEHCVAGETELSWSTLGPTGPKGQNGVNGAKGPTGAAGAKGPTGAKGPAGNKGPTGATGPAGPGGPKGATGAAGPTGPTGSTGSTGVNGSPGAAGAPGGNGPSAITTLIHDNTPAHLGADGAVKYLAFDSINLTSTQTITVNASAVLGVAAGSSPAAIEFGACYGPTLSGLPTFFDASTVQSITIAPGREVVVSTAQSKSLAAMNTFAGICVRVNAGVLDDDNVANGVLTVY